MSGTLARGAAVLGALGLWAAIAHGNALAGVVNPVLLPTPTDVLAQSYLWDAGRLYSRYAPGFPILLAGWTGLFGRMAAHTLNPTLFLAALCVVVALVWRAQRSLWAGTAAAARNGCGCAPPGARKPICLWVPSQKGFVREAPHRQSATVPRRASIGFPS